MLRVYDIRIQEKRNIYGVRIYRPFKKINNLCDKIFDFIFFLSCLILFSFLVDEVR